MTEGDNDVRALFGTTNTGRDHGTGTLPVLGRTRGSTPGIWVQSQGMSTKAAAAPEPTCNEEFAQGNREKSFFIPQVFLAVPTNVSLSSSGAEPMVSRQQQENPSKQ